MATSNPPAPRLLDTEKARLLVDAGGIVAATVRAQPGGWAVQLTTGKGGTVTLAKARGGVRTWRDLARAAAYVREELGIGSARLDMTGWEPRQKAL